RRATSHVRSEITSRITSLPLCLHRRGGGAVGQRIIWQDGARPVRASDIAVTRGALSVQTALPDSLGYGAGEAASRPAAPLRGALSAQTVLRDPLETVLGESAPRPAAPIGGAHASGFLGEVLSVQVAVRAEEGEAPDPRSAEHAALRVRVGGEIADSARVHAV